MGLIGWLSLFWLSNATRNQYYLRYDLRLSNLQTTNIEFFLQRIILEQLKNIFGERENITYLRIPAKGSLSGYYLFSSLIKRKPHRCSTFPICRAIHQNCKTIVTSPRYYIIQRFPQYFPIGTALPKIFVQIHGKRADILLTVSEYSKKQLLNTIISVNQNRCHPECHNWSILKYQPLNAREYVKNIMALTHISVCESFRTKRSIGCYNHTLNPSFTLKT